MDHFNEYDSQNKETLAEMKKHESEERHIDPKTKRNLSWMRPLLGGVIGGSLALGIYTFTPYGDHSNNQTTDTSSSQQQTESLSNSTSSTKTTETKNEKANSLSSNVSNMVEKLSPTIVGITNYQKQTNTFSMTSTSTNSNSSEAGSGSGVIFKKANGKAYIVTNNHVVEGASKLKVSLYNGKEVTAKLVGRDPLTDLAVLEISADHVTKVASFGDSTKLRTGDTVVAIGDPLGENLSRTVTQGIISGVNRTVSMPTSAGETNINVIQTDAAINPGNSGGPLLNTKGQIVGINSMKITEEGVEGIGFAIPSNDVKPIAKELLTKGKIKRPYVGITMLDLEQVPQSYQENKLGLFGNQINNGVYIRQVASGSPAKKAGLKAEDVIISVNGEKTSSGSDLRNILYKHTKVGDKIKIGILRDGQKMTKLVTLDQTEAAS